MARDLIGQQLGNYRLLRKLGKGGFAQVYLGQHVRLSMQAAIKVLHTHLSDEEINGFQHEAETIANLIHPHIVRVLDFDVSNGIPFLVMDYCPDGTLAQRHATGKRVPLSMVVSYVKQVADALQYAHDQKIIHRDVKPLNMLIGQRDTILLSDFGIASTAHSTHSMRTQNFAGSAPYMAPEQIEEHPRRESDQYALAIVTYQWLAGELPFVGTYGEILSKHLTAKPPSLCQKLSNLSVSVEEVVFKALAKDPKERFPTVQDFAIALEQASQTKVKPVQILTEMHAPVVRSLPPMVAARAAQAHSRTKTQPLMVRPPMPKQPSSPSSVPRHEVASTTKKAVMAPYIVAAVAAAVVTTSLGIELRLGSELVVGTGIAVVLAVAVVGPIVVTKAGGPVISVLLAMLALAVSGGKIAVVESEPEVLAALLVLGGAGAGLIAGLIAKYWIDRKTNDQ